MQILCTTDYGLSGPFERPNTEPFFAHFGRNFSNYTQSMLAYQYEQKISRSPKLNNLGTVISHDLGNQFTDTEFTKYQLTAHRNHSILGPCLLVLCDL